MICGTVLLASRIAADELFARRPRARRPRVAVSCLGGGTGRAAAVGAPRPARSGRIRRTIGDLEPSINELTGGGTFTSRPLPSGLWRPAWSFTTGGPHLAVAVRPRALSRPSSSASTEWTPAPRRTTSSVGRRRTVRLCDGLLVDRDGYLAPTSWSVESAARERRTSERRDRPRRRCRRPHAGAGSAQARQRRRPDRGCTHRGPSVWTTASAGRRDPLAAGSRSPGPAAAPGCWSTVETRAHPGLSPVVSFSEVNGGPAAVEEPLVREDFVRRWVVMRPLRQRRVASVAVRTSAGGSSRRSARPRRAPRRPHQEG